VPEKFTFPLIVVGVMVPNICVAVQVFGLDKFKSSVVAVLVPPTLRVEFGEVIVSPLPVPLLAAVILPSALTVMLVLVYDAAVTPDAAIVGLG
jgi:hypothetical protein